MHISIMCLFKTSSCCVFAKWRRFSGWNSHSCAIKQTLHKEVVALIHASLMSLFLRIFLTLHTLNNILFLNFSNFLFNFAWCMLVLTIASFIYELIYKIQTLQKAGFVFPTNLSLFDMNKLRIWCHLSLTMKL